MQDLCEISVLVTGIVILFLFPDCSYLHFLSKVVWALLYKSALNYWLICTLILIFVVYAFRKVKSNCILCISFPGKDRVIILAAWYLHVYTEYMIPISNSFFNILGSLNESTVQSHSLGIESLYIFLPVAQVLRETAFLQPLSMT